MGGQVWQPVAPRSVWCVLICPPVTCSDGVRGGLQRVQSAVATMIRKVAMQHRCAACEQIKNSVCVYVGTDLQHCKVRAGSW